MSWHGWSVQAPLAYVALAGLLYRLGGRRRAGATANAAQRLQTAAFLAGLLTIVLALDSPLDGWADELFWAHMLQHVLLLTVAPPLDPARAAVAADVARAAAVAARVGRAGARALADCGAAAPRLRGRGRRGCCSTPRYSSGTCRPPTTRR